MLKKCSILTLFVILVAGVYLLFFRNKVLDKFICEGKTFKVRVTQLKENFGLPEGALFLFESAPINSSHWRKITTFRHDDPIAIPHDQIQFVNENVAYFFIGWIFGVTKDGGVTWKVWNAKMNLPNWECCNYRLISSVSFQPDGRGTMRLNPIEGRRGEVPQLKTSNFGETWIP
jgi:hypothetical protein